MHYDETDAHRLSERDVIRTDRNTPFFEGDENPNLKRLNDILVTYAVFNWDIGMVHTHHTRTRTRTRTHTRAHARNP